MTTNSERPTDGPKAESSTVNETLETYPARLSRADVVNHVLSLFEAPRYLEIGVNMGVTFFAIRAYAKVAVDPKFLFDLGEARAKHPESRFYACESDDYFGDPANRNERFDVVYLDGLHTVEQTLRDFCNAIELLDDGGVIIIDDIVPNSYHASLPDFSVAERLRARFSPKDGSWMGDVYRLVFFIQSFFQQYRYATVIENHGQLVVWKDRRTSRELARRRIADVGNLPFESTITHAGNFNRLPFGAIMRLLRERPRVARLPALGEPPHP